MDVTDIPKLYTTFAEWLACLVFVLVLPNRQLHIKTACILTGFLILLGILQYQIGVWPVIYWIPAMLGAMLLMFLCIWSCCKIHASGAMLYFSIAFMFAEFVASFEWQVHFFLIETGNIPTMVRGLFSILFYSGAFSVMYLLEKKLLGKNILLEKDWRMSVSIFLLVIATFLISNISYVYPNTPFSGYVPRGIFYIRTLVDFSGVLILLIYQEKWREIDLKKEIDALNSVLHRQYEQYSLSKENIETVSRKYHDLKHQIAVLRAEQDQKKREEYLEQMEAEVKTFGIQIRTGNDVLDIILTGKQMYCVQHGITFTFVIDGALLDYMGVPDICAIFGNIMDNAIEYVEKLEDVSKRLIRAAVYSKNSFLIIRFENYCEADLKVENSLPLTTKKDKEYHGYGLKSIKNIAEKYGGTMTAQVEDKWFYLRILLPLPENKIN